MAITTINLTGLQNSTNVVDTVIAANIMANGLLGTMFVVSLTFIYLMVLVRRGNDFKKTMLVVSYIGFFISLLLSSIGFVDIYLVIVYLMLTAVFALINYLFKDN